MNSVIVLIHGLGKSPWSNGAWPELFGSFRLIPEYATAFRAHFPVADFSLVRPSGQQLL